MRESISGLLGVACFLVGPTVLADPPRFTTNWKFEAKFGDGVRTYNENLTIAVDVFIPPDLKWACQRLIPVMADGRMRASFACSSDGWKTRVFTMVGCRNDQVDPSHTAAMRIFGPGETVDGGPPLPGKWIDLTVTCETIATK
jgi:hypothetical protein